MAYKDPEKQRVYAREYRKRRTIEGSTMGKTEGGQVVVRATPAEDLNLDGIKHKIADLEYLLQECRTKQKGVE